MPKTDYDITEYEPVRCKTHQAQHNPLPNFQATLGCTQIENYSEGNARTNLSTTESLWYLLIYPTLFIDVQTGVKYGADRKAMRDAR